MTDDRDDRDEDGTRLLLNPRDAQLMREARLPDWYIAESPDLPADHGGEA